MTTSSVRLTMAQAVVRFLSQQHSARDGREQPFFGGVFGIFGHGNVAGIGQALQEQRSSIRYYLARNEQAMVHTAAAYAKMHNRLRTLACTSSIGPGATNMITGAAGATINRVPVLLLPGDIFAGRGPAPVLQQLESSASQDVSVNDCFKPVSRYWDRINRPEQILTALPGSDARADVAGGNRRRHAGAAAGRAGRSLRLSGGAVRATRLDDRPRARGSRTPAGGRGADSRQREAADRRRRRRDLQRGDRCAAPLRGRDRDRRRRNAGGQRIAAGSASADSRRRRRDRHPRGEPARARRRSRDRHRLAAQRLHDRVEDRLPARARALHQHQRRRDGRRQARRAAAGRRRARRPRRTAGAARRLSRELELQRNGRRRAERLARRSRSHLQSAIRNPPSAMCLRRT